MSLLTSFQNENINQRGGEGRDRHTNDNDQSGINNLMQPFLSDRVYLQPRTTMTNTLRNQEDHNHFGFCDITDHEITMSGSMGVDSADNDDVDRYLSLSLSSSSSSSPAYDENPCCGTINSTGNNNNELFHLPAHILMPDL